MGRKVKKGEAVDVTVPVSTTITQGDFYRLDGFLGMAMKSIVTDADTTGEVALELCLDIYETSQLDPADAFDKGDPVYWDDANDRFTTDAAAGANALFGSVYVAKNANDAAWIKRTRQDS